MFLATAVRLLRKKEAAIEESQQQRLTSRETWGKVTSGAAQKKRRKHNRLVGKIWYVLGERTLGVRKTLIKSKAFVGVGKIVPPGGGSQRSACRKTCHPT